MKKMMTKEEESQIARLVEEIKKVPISVFTAVGSEDERRQRTERLMELKQS